MSGKLADVTLTLQWNDELHTLGLSSANWLRIDAGENVTFRGQGYFYEGEQYIDRWTFNGGQKGSLAVWTDDGGTCFDGWIKDAKIWKRA